MKCKEGNLTFHFDNVGRLGRLASEQRVHLQFLNNFFIALLALIVFVKYVLTVNHCNLVFDGCWSIILHIAVNPYEGSESKGRLRAMAIDF